MRYRTRGFWQYASQPGTARDVAYLTFVLLILNLIIATTDVEAQGSARDLPVRAPLPSILPEYLGKPPSWVSGSRCGPNCLFVVLRLLGITADIDELASRCRISSKNGCSLDDLQRVAGEFAVNTEVRYLAPSAMPALRTPFIAHLSPGDERLPSGHFLVVFEYRNSPDGFGEFGIIDGTSGIYSYRDAGTLARSMSGYVLILRDDMSVWLRRMFGFGVVTFMLCASWQLLPLMRSLASKLARRSAPEIL